MGPWVIPSEADEHWVVWVNGEEEMPLVLKKVSLNPVTEQCRLYFLGLRLLTEEEQERLNAFCGGLYEMESCLCSVSLPEDPLDYELAWPLVLSTLDLTPEQRNEFLSATLELEDDTLVLKPEPEASVSRAAAMAVAEALRVYTPGIRLKVRREKKKEAPAEAGDGKPEVLSKKEGVVYGRSIKGDVTAIRDLSEETPRAVVEGQVFQSEIRETKSGRKIFQFAVTDRTGSVGCRIFAENKELEALEENVVKGKWLRIGGDYLYDTFAREPMIRVTGLMPVEHEERRDDAPVRRVELHLHTQMSTMDGMTDLNEVIKRAAKWGHGAVAITDHGVVQAFPDAEGAAAKNKIKVIYGLEAYMAASEAQVTENANHEGFGQPFVVFDVETTGLDYRKDRITEIGAVRVENGEIRDVLQTFVDPGMPIPPEVTKLTGITDEMVREAPSPAEALARFRAFSEGAALVAHNASFDMSFMRFQGAEAGIDFTDDCVVDTLAMARALFPHQRHHRLNDLTKKFGVVLAQHHRANHDAKATAEVFLKMAEMTEAMGIRTLDEVNGRILEDRPASGDVFHTVVLVRTQRGLRNLYELVSDAHLKYFHNGRPRIPKGLLGGPLREGLIIGSACSEGELYQAILRGKPDAEIERIASFYDYLEIQPVGNDMYLVREGEVESAEELKDINRKIVALGEKLGKPVVATGDVHFLEPEDEVFRRILMYGQKFPGADEQPPLYFRTTEEMLKEFDYLGEEKAYEVVVTNTRAIADTIDVIQILPTTLSAPEIPEAEAEVVGASYARAKEIYGDPLPEIVKARLEKELGAITKYNFSTLYYFARKLVWKSRSDGYLVGSRGSVGSSFVATMLQITEVNPLTPHYVCPKCRHSEFDTPKEISAGPDLPPKNCPECGTPMNREGFSCPFEVFLGFNGDKVPDIDLNFSGEYQPRIHAYTETLLKKGNVFRAGTIGTLADKTAFGYVKKYLDDHGMTASQAEIDRLVTGCTGVKRTTGQHPGGIVLVPEDREVYEFTPIQHPADKTDVDIVTTHFDFNSMHDRLVKLDELGHDDPTMLRMLQDITGIDPVTLPLKDPKVIALFSGTESLGVTPEDLQSPVATFGVPEFGTPFVRKMLVDTRPKSMAELVCISGLSHGTNVWLNNAQDLITQGICTLSQCICTREDILNGLISMGLQPKMAFDIMEAVRKGRGLKEEQEKAMLAVGVKDWFIDSCKKIKYLFPKAHAVAYVTMALRIAWYKVYRPEAYYAVYFTVRADGFDASLMIGTLDEIRARKAALDAKGQDASKLEKDAITILEVVQEMLLRGIGFDRMDLYESEAVRFTLTDKGLRPPLNVLPGLGDAAAEAIVEARKDGPFLSVEDLKGRAHLSSAVIEALRAQGCLEGFTAANQISLFDFANMGL